MSSLFSAAAAFLFGSVSQTHFAGHLAPVLQELCETSQRKRLLERAEDGHLGIVQHKNSVEDLLLLIADESVTKCQKASLCKRICEICEREQDWMFEMEPELQQSVVEILKACCHDNPRDSALLYYYRAFNC